MISFRLEIADPIVPRKGMDPTCLTFEQTLIADDSEGKNLRAIAMISIRARHGLHAEEYPMSEEGLRVLANAALATAEHLHLVRVMRGEAEP